MAGDSTVSVPQYAASHPATKCDLLSVDGGHSRGWGWGHKAFVNDGQAASWDGKEIRNTRIRFEVAVTRGPLALFEEKEVLGATK